VLTYEAESDAPPSAAWALMAEPARWSQWAPHLRGAWRLGSPEVEPGARGAARLLGVVPVPATVTGKSVAGVGGTVSWWSWRVGPVELIHRVGPRAGGGSVVGVDMRAPAPIEAALRVSYGPVVQVLVRNLARVAAR
jgi:hypothetical protein